MARRLKESAEELHGIDLAAVQPHLEVEVGTACAARTADETKLLALGDLLPGDNVQRTTTVSYTQLDVYKRQLAFR